MPKINDKTYINKEGKICMIYCIKCDNENYAPVVSEGYCAWCGYDPNDKEQKQVGDDKN